MADTLLKELKPFLTMKQHKVAIIISTIPEGKIISYSNLAKWVNSEYNLNLQAIMVAKTRRKLYGLLRPDNQFILPLHRIASINDTKANNDSLETRKEVQTMRKKEGSWDKPKWILK